MSTAVKTRKPRKSAKASAEQSAAKVDALVAETANAIIELLEAGDPGTWLQPWINTSGASILDPVNAATKGRYTGFNPWRLAYASHVSGYSLGIWATYKQWDGLGAQVRKGETGTTCIRWVTIYSKADADAAPADPAARSKSFVVPKVFTLFAAEQVDGYEVPEREAFDWDGDEAADGWFSTVPADVRHGGNRAYYAPVQDYVQVPERDSFKSGHDYYATLAHELTHWTGGADRLNRNLKGRFGDDAYAIEELIAELGSATLCAHLGLSSTPRPDHAQYLACWIKVLKEDPRAIIKVTGDAGRAVEHLLSYGAEADPESGE